MTRGAFIVIEGLDRSGKSTQCARLAARLEAAGKPVKSVKFPDRTTAIGKMINAYLQSESEVDDQTIHLLFSANRWELANDDHLRPLRLLGPRLLSSQEDRTVL